jgi:hypothetical protein
MQSFDFVVVSKRPKYPHREFHRGRIAPHKKTQIVELRAAHVPDRTDGLVFGRLELRTNEGDAFEVGQTYRLDLDPALVAEGLLRGADDLAEVPTAAELQAADVETPAEAAADEPQAEEAPTPEEKEETTSE